MSTIRVSNVGRLHNYVGTRTDSTFAVLAVTAVAQAVLVVSTGSVALLGDTLHNVADALTAVPLGIAFLLGRRLPTRRFTHGFGRAEDLADPFRRSDAEYEAMAERLQPALEAITEAVARAVRDG